MSEPSERARPPYVRIVDSIHARIRSGELGPGDRVPSTRQITREWGVAMATATKVLSTLRQEGVVEMVPGVGTVVRSSASPSNAPGKARRRNSSAHEDRQGRSDVALSRQAIVRAAIAVVDAEGIDDFSMRRVATEMNVSTMALYRHVAHRTDLVSEMIETTHREAEFPELGEADWRGALEMAVRWVWGVSRKHPWLVQLSVTAKPYVTPATMAPTEQMMRVITAEGVSPDAALEAATMLLGFSDGMAALGLVVEQPATREPDPSQWWQERAPDLTGPAGRDEFPTVSRASRPPDIDRIFAMGLERLLDSLVPMIEGANGDGE